MPSESNLDRQVNSVNRFITNHENARDSIVEPRNGQRSYPNLIQQIQADEE